LERERVRDLDLVLGSGELDRRDHVVDAGIRLRIDAGRNDG
jgi:hypothetical protein